MVMIRLWYIGEGVFMGHPRMGGVRLPKGQPVDVPGDLADELLQSGQFVDAKPEPFVEITNQTPQAVTTLEPRPLTEIAGIGESTANALDAWGIKTVEDLANLDDDRMHDVAEGTPGISKSLLRRWRLGAQE